MNHGISGETEEALFREPKIIRSYINIKVDFIAIMHFITL
jgi:hypothetical protein